MASGRQWRQLVKAEVTALNSGYAIDARAYEIYAEATATLYVDRYNWYYMPVSVHKMLMHGAHFIDMLCIPVGQVSEETIEARHKDIRRVRLYHASKTSRTRVNKDLMHWLLASIDPVAAVKRKRGIKRVSKLPQDVLSLLKESLYTNIDVENERDGSEGDGDISVK